MNLAIEKHLDVITKESFMEYRKDMFMMYARARGVELGCNATMDFIVKHDGLKEKFSSAHSAIERYKDILREKI